MRIGVVLPTIAGREELLAQTRAAYESNTPEDIELVIVVPKNASCIGDAWNAGVEALKDQDCEYLHLSADDIEPQLGWAEAGIEAADNGVYPSPRILASDGSLESCGTLGGGFYLPEVETGAPAGSSGLPFFPVLLWEYIESVPSIHYYADDFVAYRIRSLSWSCQVRRDYCFRHLEGIPGRPAMVARAMQHRQIMLEEVAKCFAPQLEPVA